MKIETRRIIYRIMVISSIPVGVVLFYFFGLIGAMACPALAINGIVLDLRTDELVKLNKVKERYVKKKEGNRR